MLVETGESFLVVNETTVVLGKSMAVFFVFFPLLSVMFWMLFDYLCKFEIRTLPIHHFTQTFFYYIPVSNLDRFLLWTFVSS